MAKKTKEKTKPQKPPKEPKQKKTKDARYSKRRKGLFFALLATLLIAVSVVGACTVFFQVETVKLKGLVALTQALSDCGLMEGVTSIDVSSGTEIQVVYQGRLTIKLLNNANFEKKMQPLRTVIAVAGDDGKGIINMKGTDKVIWTKQN